MPADGSGKYDLLDRLAEEFAARYRKGERPSLAEYTDRYPDLAEEIRELFPAMVQMEQAEECRLAPAAPAAAPAPPVEQVGDYRILREVGRGGMGVVYEAEQVSLGRRVALKVLSLQVPKDGTALARFRREARSAARLHHTNIVPMFEVGQDGDVCYYAMQFIQSGIDQDWIFLAMTHHRLGHAAEARKWLDRARVSDPLAGDRLSWDALEVELLRREAEALLKPPGP